MQQDDFIKQAIELARQGMREGRGGPFGCIIVRDGVVVGKGNNRVLETNDPTAHAEVVAIRDACSTIGNFQLDNCEVYTSCEPCPMCMGAIYWARPKAVYYASSRFDASAVGFDDSFIYEELEKEGASKSIPFYQLTHPDATALLKEWEEKDNKTLY